MKKYIVLLLSFILLHTGCKEWHGLVSEETGVAGNPVIFPTDELDSTCSSESTISTISIEIAEDTTLDKNEIVFGDEINKFSWNEWKTLLYSEYDKDLYTITPNDVAFDERLRIAALEKPWTGDKIQESLNLVGNWDYFEDRIFIDIDNDGINELIFQAHGTIFIISYNNGNIKYLGNVTDYDLFHGSVLYPPIIQKEFDKYNPNNKIDYNNKEEEKGRMWLSEANKNRKFELIYCKNNKIYFSGVSTALHQTAYIKQLIYENEEFKILTLYRWGYFNRSECSPDYFENEYPFIYKKYKSPMFKGYIDSHEYIEVSAVEIKDVLDVIYNEISSISIWNDE